MVKSPAVSIDATFAALSDPTRRALVRRLADGPLATTELAAPFAMSFPAVLKHLRVLELAGLIASAREGRVRHYFLLGGPMREASMWLEEYQAFWETQVDALEEYLKESR